VWEEWIWAFSRGFLGLIEMFLLLFHCSILRYSMIFEKFPSMRKFSGIEPGTEARKFLEIATLINIKHNSECESFSDRDIELLVDFEERTDIEQLLKFAKFPDLEIV
jgi:hypothetical protein